MVRIGGLEHVHRVDEIRYRGRLLPLRECVCQRARKRGIARHGGDMKRHVDAGQLAVERFAEIRDARLQTATHPLALRLADVAEPAVLERAERGKEDEQHHHGSRLPETLTAHAITLP